MMRGRRHPISLQLIVVALVCLHLASGCVHPYAYEPYPPRTAPALGVTNGDHAVIQLFYTTDRRPTGSDLPMLYYGADRTNELCHGRCDVSIPEYHGRGRLEAPAWFRSELPNRHVALLSISPPSDLEATVESLRRRVEQSPQREVFVFIHGYAALFGEAARRTAQIAHDIDFDGVAAVYSWPAQGWLLSYLVDAGNVEWTLPHLVEFLSVLVDRSGAERIHLMAHSMGCRVLVAGLREFWRGRPASSRPAFDQIILAAADLDIEIFERDYAATLVQASRRVTIYISAADWALGGSQRLHRYARLGQNGPTTPDAPWRDQIDVVDATAVDKGLVGHIYYGSSPDVLEDVAGVLEGRTPEQRGLQKAGRVYRIGAPDVTARVRTASAATIASPAPSAPVR